MISIARVGKDASQYYKQEDYYLADKGEWGGRLAADLSLAGEVQRGDLETSLNGFDKNGNKLVKSAGTDGHRAGIDITFSISKSVGIQMVADNSIIDMQSDSVEATMKYLENNLAQTRTYDKETDSVSYEKTNAIAYAKFMHMTSREADPQLHTHTVLMNMTQDTEGKIKTLSNETIFNNKHHLDMIYKNEMAIRLKEAGYKIEVTDIEHGSYELKGYDQKINDAFSKRREQIVDKIKELKQQDQYKGLSERRLAEIANLQTRKSKSSLPVMRKEDLQKVVNDTLKEAGTSLKDYSHTLKHQENENVRRDTAEDSILKALESLHDNNSAVTKTNLIAEAIKLNMGEYRLKDYEDGIQTLRDEGKVIIMGEHANKNGLQLYVSSSEMIDTEQRIIQNAKDMQKTGGMKFAKDEIDKYITKTENEGFKYTDSQKNAVYKLGMTSGNLLVMQGDAGTGKTSSVYKSIAELATENGYTVKGMTPTGVAALELAKGAKIDAQTIDSFLIEAEKNVGTANGKELLIVDEASMISSRKMDQLVTYAKDNNAVIILGGDVKQFKPVGEGKIFEDLQRAGIKHAEVVDVVRQKTDHMKQVVEQVGKFYNNINTSAKNDDSKLIPLQKAISEIDKHGNLKNESDRAKRIENTVQDYKEIISSGKSSLIIVSANDDRKEINNATRESLKKDGQLKDEISVTTYRNKTGSAVKKEDVRFYNTGDVIKFNSNIRPDGKHLIDKSTKLTVLSTDTETNRLKLQDDNGRKYTMNPAEISKKFNVYSNEEISIAAGDRIVFTNNKNISSMDSDTKEIKNGTTATVIAADTNRITVQTAGGKEYNFSTKDMLFIDHGYAQNLHKTQGESYDAPVWYVDPNKRMSLDAAYVAMTRAKEEIKIHTGFSKYEISEYQGEKNISENDARTELLSKKIAKENQKVSTLDEFKESYKKIVDKKIELVLKPENSTKDYFNVGSAKKEDYFDIRNSEKEEAVTHEKEAEQISLIR